ncbi:MAG: HU family DNA-binding protein [Ignavibacteria bacterium]|nr:HU family DNA-binding protein [Bacteroidota bacterium]MSQ45988.1 HU family DNA-binding protein [Ignavibacteria bacterium]
MPGMSKSAVINHFATKFDMKKRAVAAFFEELSELAYREAPNQFSLPGLGKIVLVQRNARMGRNPKTGESISIPAKKVVKFKVSKVAKEAILSRVPSF